MRCGPLHFFYSSGSSCRRRTFTDKCGFGAFAQRGALHDGVALCAWRGRHHLLCFWICLAGVYRRPSALLLDCRKKLELAGI